MAQPALESEQGLACSGLDLETLFKVPRQRVFLIYRGGNRPQSVIFSLSQVSRETTSGMTRNCLQTLVISAGLAHSSILKKHLPK